MSAAKSVSSNDVHESGDPIDLPLKRVKLSGGTQPRETISNDTIAEYAEEMIGGAVFPPVTVYYDGTDYWPSDGFHRIKAAMRAKRETISAKVVQGTRRDAVLASFAANSDHGLRRANADKRRAVVRMLEDDEWTLMSDSAIARHCRVSASMVGSLRVKLGIVAPAVKTTIQRGKTVVMNTSNCGAHKRKPVLDAPDFSRPPAEVALATRPSLFDSFVKKVRARGVDARTHVATDFGTIDIVTPDAVYIVAGDMNARVFRDAFVTLLFQRRGSNGEKRAVIVGTTTPDLTPWVREAKRHGVEVVEFNG